MTGFSPLAGGALAGMTAFPNVMVPGMPAQQPPAAYPGAYSAAAQQAVPAAYSAQPPAAASMPAGANEGWVKLRGVAFTASKQDFMVFFQVGTAWHPSWDLGLQMATAPIHAVGLICTGFV